MTERFKGHIATIGFVEKDGRVLVVRERVPHNDPNAQVVLSQPGGHVEPVEMFSEAIVREVMEETGYKIKPLDLVGIYQFVYQDKSTNLTAYRCELLDDTQYEIEAPEVVEALWLTEEEIMARTEEHRSKNTTKRFKDYFAGKRLPMETLTEVDHRKLAN
jgi:8-oxo-dGTP pyrophosphatase MutT (NUDIX family)